MTQSKSILKYVICGIFIISILVFCINHWGISSSYMSVDELVNTYNPKDTGKAVNLQTDESGTYTYINGKKQYIQLDNDTKNNVLDFGNVIVQGIKAGKIKNLSNTDRKNALKAWGVFSYTDSDTQIPVIYCDEYYPVPRYQMLFKKIFGKAHLEAQNKVISLYGQFGFEYLLAAEKQVGFPDMLTAEMDENYEDFKNEMLRRGVKKVTKAMFCRFINDVPEAIVEQQLDVFKIQHPDYIQFLPDKTFD